MEGGNVGRKNVRPKRGKGKRISKTKSIFKIKVKQIKEVLGPGGYWKVTKEKHTN